MGAESAGLEAGAEGEGEAEPVDGGVWGGRGSGAAGGADFSPDGEAVDVVGGGLKAGDVAGDAVGGGGAGDGRLALDDPGEGVVARELPTDLAGDGFVPPPSRGATARRV